MAGHAEEMPSAGLENEVDDPSGKRKRRESSLAPFDSPSATINEDGQQESKKPRHEGVQQAIRYLGADIVNVRMFEPPDQKAEITNELESGSHTLMLEPNHATNAKCRAHNCLLLDHRYRRSDKLRSRYRLNLDAKVYDNSHWTQLAQPNRRFFHVSCLESIGVDIEQHLTLPPERVATLGGMQLCYLHPAIQDWVKFKGKSYDLAMYAGYEKALEAGQVRQGDEDTAATYFRMGKGRAPEPAPVQWEKSEYFVGEPTKRTLSDVLLQTMKAEHLLDASAKVKITVLEIVGRVPEGWTKEALEAELAEATEAAEEAKEADGQEKGAGADPTDNSASKNRDQQPETSDQSNDHEQAQESVGVAEDQQGTKE